MAVSRSSQSKRKITLAEIAQAAQVSKSAVSLVLNDAPSTIPIGEATRRRILDAAKELGYKRNAAARALVTGRSYTILVVLFYTWHKSLFERLRGAETYLNPLGYSLRFCTISAEGGLASFTEILGSGQADGVLLAGTVTTEIYSIFRDLCSEAAEAGVPVVALADGFPRDEVNIVVNAQEEQGAEDAVTHLIGHGHKRILFVGMSDRTWSENRERGYRSALRKAGIPIDPRLIALGYGQIEIFAYEVTRQLAHSLDFTAMFAVNDSMAFAVLSALKQEGIRVPEDCAVVGFNDDDIAPFTYSPLTTVHHPFCETGKAAAEMLVNMIEGKPAENVSLPMSLVIRNSCGC